MRLYDQIFQRFIVYKEKLTEKPAQFVVREKKDFPESKILRSVAKQYKRKTEELLHFIKSNSSLGWNDSGEIVCDDRAVPSSNIKDLVAATAKKEKSFTGLERVSESASRLSGSSTIFDFSETQAEMGDLQSNLLRPEESWKFWRCSKPVKSRRPTG